MHRALLLPEIVAAILANGATIHRLLYRALTVNKLFSSEAARLLWYRCGERSGVNLGDYNALGIRHFIPIVKRDIGRAQYYANLVRVLSFSNEGDHYEGTYITAFHCFNALSQLKFPNLEEAIILTIEYDILRYIPKLRSLHVQMFKEAPKTWFDDHTALFSNLKRLKLNLYDRDSIPPETLHRLLERTQSLEDLYILPSKRYWSPESFLVVSRYPNLRYLSCPVIESYWIDLSTSGFVALESLHTAISLEALEHFHRQVPQLVSLTVTATSKHLITCAANFTMLRHLSITVTDYHDHGKELVHLSQRCSHLVTLVIHGIRPLGAHDSDLSDQVMESVAGRLPDLEEVKIHYDSTENTPLTMASMLSFAKHCPRLRKLQTFMNLTWHNLVHDIPAGTVVSSSLESMGLFLGRFHMTTPEYEDTIGEEKVKSVAKSLTHAFPALESFTWLGKSKGETAMTSHLDKVMHKRILRKHLPIGWTPTKRYGVPVSP
jgi:hypothetical protein